MSAVIRVPLVRRDGDIAGERIVLKGLAGDKGPIEVSAELVSLETLRDYWSEIDSQTPALFVAYRGHRDDLIGAGCFPLGLEQPFHEFHAFRVDGYGGLYWVSNSAARGRRGWMSIHYYAASKAFASALPWIQELAAAELSLMGEPLYRPSWLPPRAPARALH